MPEFVKDKKISLKVSMRDEKILYAEAMEGVQKISNKTLIKRPIPKKVHCVAKENDPRRLLEEAVADKRKLNVANMPRYMEGYAEGTNPITIEKLKNGEFSIQKTLDLHGLSIDDAKVSLEEFIVDSIKSCLNCVKVVHGRGLKSKGVPCFEREFESMDCQGHE